MAENKTKLQIVEDCKAVIEEAKSMGCNKVRALYNIPVENMELIVQALEKQIPKNELIDTENFSKVMKDCFDDMITVVKQGGVSDDVCEYRITDKVVYASCNNKQIASAFCWFDECGDYKYCPYCGKRIKVVE